MAQTAPTRRRSARGWGARLAGFLSSLIFPCALAIGAIQDYSSEITPIFWDGVDDDAVVPLLSALPNDGMKDFSKREKVFGRNVGELIGSRSVASVSTATRAAWQIRREPRLLHQKRPPSVEYRASREPVPDPH